MGGRALASSDLRKGMGVETTHITVMTDIADTVDIVAIIAVAMIGGVIMSIVTAPMIIGVIGITKGTATGASKVIIRGITEAIIAGTTQVTLRGTIAGTIKVIPKASTLGISKVSINT